MKMESIKYIIFKRKMPSKKVLTPLLGGSYYHIFNRGINRQPIFFTKSNYQYFLELMSEFLIDHVSILSYCLLPNHFHLVIRLKDEIRPEKLSTGIPSLTEDGILTDTIQIGKYVSNQLRRLFIKYALAINKQEKRTGSLLDKNFKRLVTNDDEYLKHLVYYTHYNPKKHGYVKSFTEYRFSSFRALTMDMETRVDKEMVYNLFKGREGFVNYHYAVDPPDGLPEIE